MKASGVLSKINEILRQMAETELCCYCCCCFVLFLELKIYYQNRDLCNTLLSQTHFHCLVKEQKSLAINKEVSAYNNLVLIAVLNICGVFPVI